MKLFDRCPVCGERLREKKVEKLLRGGSHTAICHVNAQVCLHCGERLYTPQTVRRFEQIRAKLAHGDLDRFEVVGKTVHVS